MEVGGRHVHDIYSDYEYELNLSFSLQGKLCASLLWFVCRLSEEGQCDIPPELTSPIEYDQPEYGNRVGSIFNVLNSHQGVYM